MAAMSSGGDATMTSPPSASNWAAYQAISCRGMAPSMMPPGPAGRIDADPNPNNACRCALFIPRAVTVARRARPWPSSRLVASSQSASGMCAVGRSRPSTRASETTRSARKDTCMFRFSS